jgi:hypothetical protein
MLLRRYRELQRRDSVGSRASTRLLKTNSAISPTLDSVANGKMFM